MTGREISILFEKGIIADVSVFTTPGRFKEFLDFAKEAKWQETEYGILLPTNLYYMFSGIMTGKSTKEHERKLVGLFQTWTIFRRKEQILDWIKSSAFLSNIKSLNELRVSPISDFVHFHKGSNPSGLYEQIRESVGGITGEVFAEIAMTSERLRCFIFAHSRGIARLARRFGIPVIETPSKVKVTALLRRGLVILAIFVANGLAHVLATGNIPTPGEIYESFGLKLSIYTVLKG